MTHFSVPLLFIDMDGVLADFEKHYEEVFDVDIKLANEDQNKFWKRIHNYDHGTGDFFYDIPLMEDALDAWNQIKHLNPIILTACPASDYYNVGYQKIRWVRDNLDQSCMIFPVVGGKNKGLFVHNDFDILVDDHHKNSARWVERGGQFILHTSWKDSLEILRVMHPRF